VGQSWPHFEFKIYHFDVPLFTAGGVGAGGVGAGGVGAGGVGAGAVGAGAVGADTGVIAVVVPAPMAQSSNFFEDSCDDLQQVAASE